MATQPRPAGKTARTGLRLVTPDLQTGSVALRNRDKPDISDVQIGVDDNQTIGYNSRWFVRHAIAWWFYLLPHLLPKPAVRWLFAGTSRHINQIFVKRKGWQALHELYNWERRGPEAQLLPNMLHLPEEKHFWNRFAACFWENIIVCGAGTRNRFLQVKHLAERQFAVTSSSRPFRILSIGCGSGQAILEAIWEERRLNPTREFHLTALDMSTDALKALRELADALGIPRESIFTKKANITSVATLAKWIDLEKYDLIEVVGFSEYQETTWLIELARVLRDHLSPGGVLLFNNMRRTKERWFTSEIMDWPLNLKDPETLATIMVAAGFSPLQVEIIAEPTRTFYMAQAKKETD